MSGRPLDASVRSRARCSKRGAAATAGSGGVVTRREPGGCESMSGSWRDQIGPALSQADVARMLGAPQEAVQSDPHLLMLNQPGSRQPVYPVIQFHNRHPIPGLADVLEVLRGVLLPESIAAWLTSARPDLDGRRPIDVLRDMPSDGRVLELAQRQRAAAT